MHRVYLLAIHANRRGPVDVLTVNADSLDLLVEVPVPGQAPAFVLMPVGKEIGRQRMAVARHQNQQ